MKITNAFNNFINSRKAKGLKQKSICNYVDFVMPFVREHKDVDIEKLPYSDVEDYIIRLYAKSLSKATISTYITHIKAFLHWCFDNYEMTFSYKKIQPPKVYKKDVHLLSPDEIGQILQNVTGTEEWIKMRNRCIIILMYDSGLRQSEVCSIRKDDIDYYNNTITVKGKGDKERKVPLGSTARNYIKAYLSLCPFDTELLFVERRGEAISANAVKKFIQKMKSVLPFEFYSHLLRHNFATNYLIDQYTERGTMDSYGLMALLGHEDMATSQRYIHAATEVIACRSSISHLDKVLKPDVFWTP